MQHLFRNALFFLVPRALQILPQIPHKHDPVLLSSMVSLSVNATPVAEYIHLNSA